MILEVTIINSIYIDDIYCEKKYNSIMFYFNGNINMFFTFIINFTS